MTRFRHKLGLRALLVGACLFVATGGLCGTPLPEGWTGWEKQLPQLDALLQAALQQAPDLLVKQGEIQQAEGNAEMARAQMLPRLDSVILYSVTRTVIADQSNVSDVSQGLYYGLSAMQPIFHWGTLKAQSDSAKIGAEIARQNFSEAYRLLALSVRTQYLGLIVKKAALVHAQQLADSTQATARRAAAQLQAGDLAPDTEAEQRLAAEEAQITRDRAAADLTAAARAVGRLCGTAAPAVDSLPDRLPAALSPPPPDSRITDDLLLQFESIGLEQTPRVQALRHAVDQADLAYKVARFRLYPKGNLSLSNTQSNSIAASANTLSQTGVQSVNASLVFNWPLFDGFATRGAKRSALAARRIADRRLNAELAASRDEVRAAESAVELAARTLRVASIRRERAATELQKITERLSRGEAASAEVETATLSLRAAELTATAAQADWLIRRAEFISLLGLEPAPPLAPSPAQHD